MAQTQKTAHLSIGDPAPPLAFGADIQGGPVHAINGHRVTVVEFWATWCGPCIANMPHMSEIYKANKLAADFVGVSIWEDDFGRVAPFIKGMGDKVAYPIAIDTKDGAMARTWMTAAGQGAIPTVFIVDQSGKIAWVGHPTKMEEPLKQVIAGTWDPTEYKKTFELAVLNSDETAKLVGNFYDVVVGAAVNGTENDVLEWIQKEGKNYHGTDVPETLDYTRRMFKCLANTDYEESLKLANDPPKNNVVSTYYAPVLLQVKIAALQGSGDLSSWKKLANDAIDASRDPNLLQAIADGLTSPKCVLPDRDPSIAVHAAEKLVQLDRNSFFLLSLA